MNVAQLYQIPLFNELDHAVLEDLAIRIGQRSIRAGEVLFRQGEPGRECFAIISGALEVLIYLNGEELRLDIYHTGQIIGEMALIDHSPRSATVRAQYDSELLVLGEEAFKTLVRSSPDLAMVMLRNGSERVRNSNQRMIADLEHKNAELLLAYQQLQNAQSDLIRLSRIEEELAVARRIQSSFLPRHLPQPRGWQVAAYSRGAQAVGGDFFDCIDLGAGRLGLVVADACGKGVTAALFVALTRSLVRAVSQAPWIMQSGPEHSAESVLAAAMWLVNDYLCREHGDSNMFVTLFYGVLDLRTGVLVYSNAGHSPPLLVDPTKELIDETSLGGVPLGILATQRYEVLKTTILPGGMLVAFSDGITDAASPGDERFGDDRLHQALRVWPGLRAEALVEQIINQVDTFAAGATQADDMTMLVVARDQLT